MIRKLTICKHSSTSEVELRDQFLAEVAKLLEMSRTTFSNSKRFPTPKLVKLDIEKGVAIILRYTCNGTATFYIVEVKNDI